MPVHKCVHIYSLALRGGKRKGTEIETECKRNLERHIVKEKRGVCERETDGDTGGGREKQRKRGKEEIEIETERGKGMRKKIQTGTQRNTTTENVKE